MNPDELRDALAELGWKQSDFCAKAGIERNTSSRWINGHNPIPAWVPAFLGAMLEIKRLHAKYIESK
jgi:transcriptional regulator with XRE-family HTH domain